MEYTLVSLVLSTFFFSLGSLIGSLKEREELRKDEVVLGSIPNAFWVLQACMRKIVENVKNLGSIP
jgi:hypothetical protein